MNETWTVVVIPSYGADPQVTGFLAENLALDFGQRLLGILPYAAVFITKGAVTPLRRGGENAA